MTEESIKKEPNLSFYMNKNKDWQKGLTENDVIFIKNWIRIKTGTPLCFDIQDKYLMKMIFRNLTYNDNLCPVVGCNHLKKWYVAKVLL